MTGAPRSGGSRAAVLVLAGLAPVLGIDAALAASDTTFSGPLDTVTDIVAGTGGQLAAALAVGAALVGSVLRFNATQLLGAQVAGARVLLTVTSLLDYYMCSKKQPNLWAAKERGCPDLEALSEVPLVPDF